MSRARRAAALVLVLSSWTGVPAPVTDLAAVTDLEEARAPGAHSSRIAGMESEVARRVNDLRREHRRAPLRIDPVLARVAREYACALARRDTLSHTGPSGQTVVDRVRGAGRNHREVGENLASNLNARDPVAAAVTGWMRSPGHRDNILRPTFTETGVGICRDGDGTYYFTQVFLRPA